MNNLINLNSLHLGLTCPNLLMSHISYTKYVKELPMFVNEEKIYQEDFTSYCNFIIYKIIINSLDTKKNINTYEQYFFTTLEQYSKNKNLNFEVKYIAKLWKKILDLFLEIMQVFNKYIIKSFSLNEKRYLPFPHLTSKVTNFDYYFITAIELITVDDYIICINLLPTSLSDILLLNLAQIKYYNYSKLRIYNFSLSTFDIQLIDTNLYKPYYKLYDQYIIKFSVINLSHCSICKISNLCTKQHKLLGTKPNLTVKKYNEKLKILFIGDNNKL